MVLIFFVQVLKKVLKSLKFELKYPGGTLINYHLEYFGVDWIIYCLWKNPFMLIKAKFIWSKITVKTVLLWNII